MVAYGTPIPGQPRRTARLLPGAALPGATGPAARGGRAMSSRQRAAEGAAGASLAGAPETGRAGEGRQAPDAAWDALLQSLAPSLADRLARLAPQVQGQVDEVRVVAGAPLWVLLAGGEGFVDAAGRLVPHPGQAPAVTAAEVAACLERMTASSWYAVQEEARQGFLTLPGGHRVGLAGEVQVDGGRIERFRRVDGLVIRRARPVPGCAVPLLPRLVEPGPGAPRLASTLVIGAPASGKTTLLRDLARLASTGRAGTLAPQRVAVVDERGELAAGGAFDLGPRTVVLAHCPKETGIPLALRALSPEVLVTDELGGPGDAAAVAEAVHAGVTVVATAHAGSPADLEARRQLRALEATGTFRRLVQLARRPRPGTAVAVYARGTGGRWIALDGDGRG
ncbi:MAG TPA: AAA family ATPase [Thermaerobacter sp.]